MRVVWLNICNASVIQGISHTGHQSYRASVIQGISHAGHQIFRASVMQGISHAGRQSCRASVVQDRATYLCSLQPTHQHIVHKQQVLAANATCDLSAADNSSSPATQACESRRHGTGLQPVAPAWVIPSYHSTPRAMHTPAHMVASPSHLHVSPPTRPHSAQVSPHVPHCCPIMDYYLRLACSSSLCCLIGCFCAALLLTSAHHQQHP